MKASFSDPHRVPRGDLCDESASMPVPVLEIPLIMPALRRLLEMRARSAGWESSMAEAASG